MDKSLSNVTHAELSRSQNLRSATTMEMLADEAERTGDLRHGTVADLRAEADRYFTLAIAR